MRDIILFYIFCQQTNASHCILACVVHGIILILYTLLNEASHNYYQKCVVILR